MKNTFQLSKSIICVLLIVTTLLSSLAQASGRIRKCKGVADGLFGEFENLEFNITKTIKNIAIAIPKYDAVFSVIYSSNDGKINIATSEKLYEFEFGTNLAVVEWSTQDSGVIKLGAKVPPFNSIGKHAHYEFVCE